ncbi:response regulator [Rudanella paleaurantiibacter]|uniref:Response regulator n=1 Tax=Rudanella paleaurantiibacter TaxID=2614655 RepID=A0A7J5TU22_9BACT|nr:response regulator transcription factor [Rudanella paleaurantiibacter]KAB7727376.1 response regulator [Rudanella paleaurantiibacter]
MKHILLAEDEVSVVEFIRRGLIEENYTVSVAFNGSTGLKMALDSSYDLIILDIMLPDMNGLEVCQKLRSNHLLTPILFLTALGTAENVVTGLNAGADDYLVKPFKFIELNARINALLRRANQKAEPEMPSYTNLYVLADLRVDDTAKTVTRSDQPIQLTATEYRLLLALIKNKGKVLSRIDLLESAWDLNFNTGTNVVDVYINYLRRKIDSAAPEKLIHTVVGMGYVLKEP